MTKRIVKIGEGDDFIEVYSDKNEDDEPAINVQITGNVLWVVPLLVAVVLVLALCLLGGLKP